MSIGRHEQRVMDQSGSGDPPAYWTADLDPVTRVEVEAVVRNRYRENGEPLPTDPMDFEDLLDEEIGADVENGMGLDYAEALALAELWDRGDA